ncbi:tRNA wybutosine-synthesizing protein 5-like [Oppia nitens]|uniref:tRNA wybutosine-synthesizing protein 5-like n=1 Tax=Oppia nitens TaxID=1686743 RepID=UPI0023DBD2D0|nr:tRNA wybutosine-synthesizing protein 5-like [Oppia nitens]
MNVLTVEKYQNLDKQSFNELIEKDIPFVIRDADFGYCMTQWSADYLKDRLGETKVTVHQSMQSMLNFIDKNFLYKTLPFNEMIDKCLNDDQHYYYLRSIGSDRRARDVADIRAQFTEISDDVTIPSFMSICQKTDECRSTQDCHQTGHRQLFSSVFRISSKDLVLWTHYDILDNILVQIKGRKRVVLFPPDNCQYLYLESDKSRVIDIDEPEDLLREKFPLFLNVDRYECVLEEGESLFIPSLWFHNTTALEFSIGMNFFWKDKQLIDDNMYNKSDVYGNKDLNPAVDAFANVDKLVKHLDKMPKKFTDFYLRVIINKLQNKLN